MNAYRLSGIGLVLFLLVILSVPLSLLNGGAAANWLVGDYDEPSPSYSYLPLILKDVALPKVPILYDIDNADGDGSFSINWSISNFATSYTLEEAGNADFSSPTVIYSGTGLTKAVVGKTLGTYYYRVRAENAFGPSSWSGVTSASVTHQAELICEIHEFGTVGVAWPIYTSGRTEHFIAVNNMLVETVEVMSVLKALPAVYVYIAVGINEEQLASKNTYVFSNAYTSYYINKDVASEMNAGDDIYYYIAKAVGDPEAWIKWGNYVKLCGR